MPIFAIARKDLRLLLRDPRSAIILLLMPLLLILVLGLTIGDAFGRKTDDRIRISVVVLDAGPVVQVDGLPKKTWAEIALDDLTDTGNVRVERIATRELAEQLVQKGDRAAVVVFQSEFSTLVDRCSFVDEPFKSRPINPLYRDGMKTREIGVVVLADPRQQVSAAVIEQVVQVTLLRVVIPWMIGNAFEQIGTPAFMGKMDQYIPGLTVMPKSFKESMGGGIQRGIGGFFSNYKFTAKSWAGLTKGTAPPERTENRTEYESDGTGLLTLKRGSARYQILVPGYTVTFAFFLTLSVGWLFVAERRYGTLTRLHLAPIAPWQLLAGKWLPCFAVSVLQGLLLLLCGKWIFGMSWGPQPAWLLLTVLCTSFAATGLAMLVAVLARTEAQVAIYGTLLVLLLAGLSGSLLPRDLMPEEMRKLSLLTPHAWALDAYAELLNPTATAIHAERVLACCGMLAAFGAVFTLVAYLWLRRRT